tara:strand:+ start:954 stop:1409 length:456 start_codon:yes stop_codon:yes gene_type:complete
MPFLGNSPPRNFESLPSVQEFSGDGSVTVFTLTTSVSSSQSILVSVDGVIQEAGDSYTVTSGTTLTFSGAPSSNSGNNIFVVYLGKTATTITPALENKGTFKAGSIFRTNIQTLSTSVTILASENAQVTGPLTVASGITVTVEDGGRFVVT